VPQDYAVEVCSLFAQLGAQGTSVIFSSGDSGVGSNGDCVSNDGKNTQMFLPAFPASCPFVTAVGSTKGINPEVPTTEFSSGGGFSNYFVSHVLQRPSRRSTDMLRITGCAIVPERCGGVIH
jgi:tripeptidyl-peptidase-1